MHLGLDAPPSRHTSDWAGERSGGTAPDPALPLPALVAGWLRDQVGAAEVTVHLIPPDLPPADCRALGARLAADQPTKPLGLLVLGDGSHRHGERAVGRPDPRATTFDTDVHAALATTDPAALLAGLALGERAFRRTSGWASGAIPQSSLGKRAIRPASD